MIERAGDRQPTRREVIKGTAAGAVGAVGPSAIDPRAYAKGDEVLRVGLIGCGGRGSGAAVQFLKAHPSNRLVAMADLFDAHLRNSRSQIRKAVGEQVAVDDEHAFVGFDAYEKVIGSDVDVVLIACSSKFHPLHLEAAVRAGKHVFVEKPHAIDSKGVARVLAACDEAKTRGVSVFSGLMSRYDPGMRQAVERVLDGAIGDVVAARAYFLRTPYSLTPPRSADTEIEYQYRNWYHFTWLSGDDVTQSLVHNVDRIAWAMGETQPARAEGLGGRSASFGRIYGSVFDHHAVVYEYGDARQLTACCRTQKGCFHETSDILFGTKGRCDLLDRRIDGEKSWRYEGKTVSMYQEEQNALSEAIRAGRTVNHRNYMAASTLTAIMGQVACYTGKRVDRQELSRAAFRFDPDPEACSFSLDPPVKPNKKGRYPVAVPGKTELL